MIENRTSPENDLVNRAIQWLQQALPQGWKVQRSEMSFGGGNQGQPQSLGDAGLDLIADNTVRTTFIVEVKRSYAPRDVEATFGASLARNLRTVTFNFPILVISDWLSPRTRELLSGQGINYLDLTGNALIRLSNPTLFISSMGAAKASRQATKGQVSLRGAKAAEIVRLLIDVRPPYGVREVGVAAGVVASWVSRLLDFLDREALVERSARGRVESVDIPRLLRRWAETYDVFSTNEAKTFLAPPGARAALERMKDTAATGRLAVTGSFAAVRRAPVAAPALLVAYAEDLDQASGTLSLLPATEGSNVVLLRPFDPVVWQRTDAENGITFVAPSQAAVDCLTGNGRMPQEGEALIDWMVANESTWRVPSLASISPKAK